MKEEYEIKFWKDWLEADNIKRLKLVENLLMVKKVFKVNKVLLKKHRAEFFAQYLNGFFED